MGSYPVLKALCMNIRQDTSRGSPPMFAIRTILINDCLRKSDIVDRSPCLMEEKKCCYFQAPLIGVVDVLRYQLLLSSKRLKQLMIPTTPTIDSQFQYVAPYHWFPCKDS